MDKPTCSVPGCEKTARAGSAPICSMHRWRLKNHGSFELPPKREAPSLAEILDVKSKKGAGCWEWQGTIDHYGYGQICRAGKRYKAHRVAYETWVEAIPPRMVIDHACHNPACVRPDHLRAVSVKQNTENHSGPTAANRSGVRGVYWHSQAERWAGQVSHNGRRYSAGTHRTLAEAEAAVVALRVSLHTHNDADRGSL